FSTLRIPLLKGRVFGREDRPETPLSAVVNATLAERLWPRREALGQRLVENGRTVTVVGVVKNGKYRRLWETPLPFLYLSDAQVGPLRRGLLGAGGGSPPATLGR